MFSYIIFYKFINKINILIILIIFILGLSFFIFFYNLYEYNIFNNLIDYIEEYKYYNVIYAMDSEDEDENINFNNNINEYNNDNNFDLDNIQFYSIIENDFIKYLDTLPPKEALLYVCLIFLFTATYFVIGLAINFIMRYLIDTIKINNKIINFIFKWSKTSNNWILFIIFFIILYSLIATIYIIIHILNH